MKTIGIGEIFWPIVPISLDVFELPRTDKTRHDEQMTQEAHPYSLQGDRKSKGHAVN